MPFSARKGRRSLPGGVGYVSERVKLRARPWPRSRTRVRAVSCEHGSAAPGGKGRMRAGNAACTWRAGAESRC
eukprot:1688757-Pleurochrysis_carterae.AAC.1